MLLLRRISVLFAVLAVVLAEEDAAKAVRMKTSRQLREILHELDIDAPASLSKDDLRKLALDTNAIPRWEELHPEKKRRPRAATGGIDGMAPPEGMSADEWANIMGKMRGDFSHEPDPEKRRILEKLKAKGISFGGGSDMDIEQYAAIARSRRAAHLVTMHFARVSRLRAGCATSSKQCPEWARETSARQVMVARPMGTSKRRSSEIGARRAGCTSSTF